MLTSYYRNTFENGSVWFYGFFFYGFSKTCGKGTR